MNTDSYTFQDLCDYIHSATEEYTLEESPCMFFDLLHESLLDKANPDNGWDPYGPRPNLLTLDFTFEQLQQVYQAIISNFLLRSEADKNIKKVMDSVSSHFSLMELFLEPEQMTKLWELWNPEIILKSGKITRKSFLGKSNSLEVNFNLSFTCDKLEKIWNFLDPEQQSKCIFMMCLGMIETRLELLTVEKIFNILSPLQKKNLAQHVNLKEDWE